MLVAPLLTTPISECATYHRSEYKVVSAVRIGTVPPPLLGFSRAHVSDEAPG